MKAPRQLPRARQALAGSEIVPENAENNLRHKLFANADLAPARKPKLHGRLSYG